MFNILTRIIGSRKQRLLRQYAEGVRQANGSVARGGKYLNRIEMADAYAALVKQRPTTNPLIFDRMAEIIPGWQLVFDTTERGYWFMIKDKEDPCGFAYVSNENGVIYNAEPIR